MDKTKTETGDNIFSLHQSKTQEREVSLRVDCPSKDLPKYFDWRETNKVFLYTDKDWNYDSRCYVDSDYYITEMPHAYEWKEYWETNICDISLNEDKTLKYEDKRHEDF